MQRTMTDYASSASKTYARGGYLPDRTVRERRAGHGAFSYYHRLDLKESVLISIIISIGYVTLLHPA